MEADWYRLISDGFAVPGFVLLFLGSLGFLREKGAFSGLQYVFDNTLRMLTFRERKPYERKPARPVKWKLPILLSTVFLALSALFAALFVLNG